MVLTTMFRLLVMAPLGRPVVPDVYRIKNQISVLDAIAMAGGFTDLARPNKVIVLRNTAAGPQRIRINIKQLVDDDSKTPFLLQTLDTVYVE